ncbi:MAG: hypothetical protein LBV75_02590 [Paludibacter sp.]|nr:hypothetical protein [Paludibacter sp.]
MATTLIFAYKARLLKFCLTGSDLCYWSAVGCASLTYGYEIPITIGSPFRTCES